MQNSGRVLGALVLLSSLSLVGRATFAATATESARHELTISSRDGSMYRVDLSNGERTALGRIRGAQLAWSPNGATVAYRTGRLGDLAIASAPFVAGRIISESPGPSAESPRPAWHPEGRLLAFVCSPRVAIDAICVREIIATNTSVALSFQKFDSVTELAWSPNGKRIALEFHDGKLLRDALRGGPVARRVNERIRLLDVSTGKLRDLTNPRHGPRGLPRWGPDGSLFLASCGARRSINVVPSGTTRQSVLIRIPHGCAYQLDVSPDGRLIAFAAGRGIWTANADGSGLRRIVREIPAVTGLRFRRLPG